MKTSGGPMETAAFLGILGLGYIFQNKDKKPTKEGFKNQVNNTEYEAIPPGESVTKVPAIRPAKIPVNSAAGELDIMYAYPAEKPYPSEPKPEKKPRLFEYGFPQNYVDTIQKDVKLETGSVEKTPVLAKEKKVFVSPLTGLPMKPEEFTHANMVPFFRGNLKQNMSDTANRNILDNHTGGGFFQQKKREIGAMFDQTKEPTGVPFGSEIATDFMQGRVVAPTNRAGERPFEQIRVGKGLGEGFTSNPSGGYQQANALDYARPRSTDELRTANNPKLTYKGVAIRGANFITKPGTIGEVRKHLPDKFYINEKGERNFTTTGANLKATERPVQVLRDTTRPETTKEYEGPAKSQDYNATYTVPSTRAPMVKQHGTWGYRNANATAYFDKNVDSDQNDYGKASIEIRPNERYFTGERSQTLNPKPQGTGKVALPLQDGPRQTRKDEMLGNPNQAGYLNVGAGGVGKGPAYDPNDTARTTIKETTIDNDYLGNAAGPLKLAVYDPNDVARTTIKETTIDNEYVGQVAGPVRLAIYDPNDIARTTVKETTIDNEYVGQIAGPVRLAVYDPNDVARKTIKETTIDNDYLGQIAGPNKSPAYDPNDVARVTIKETTINNDYLGTVAGPIKQTVYDPTDTARTTIKETTGDNDYIGTASGPQKLTVYDPDDIARTTIKETTIDNGYIGIISNKESQKQRVYDPDDIAKLTQRNTIENFDTTRNFSRSDNPDKPYLPFTDIARVTDREELSAKSEYYGNSDPNYPKNMVNPFTDGARLTQKAAISANSSYTGSGYAEDKKPLVTPFLDGARKTQKSEISARSSYTGSAGTANAKAPRDAKAERAMRQYAQKENVAKGRAPAGNIAVFNGEDYMNVKHKKIESDYINDRNPNVNRVLGMPPSDDIIGKMKPRVVLKMDVSKDRMEPAVISGLQTNPYVIPLNAAPKISDGKVIYGKNAAASINAYRG